MLILDGLEHIIIRTKNKIFVWFANVEQTEDQMVVTDEKVTINRWIPALNSTSTL